MLQILNDQTSIIQQYVRELRDVVIQKDPRRFERNLERIGILAGYEASKLLRYTDIETTTPLGTVTTPVLTDKVVIATILRAGVPLHHGVRQVFDDAEITYIAAGRKSESTDGVEIDLSYIATPRIDNKVLIIADTMLATGKSLVDAYRALTTDYGTPSRTIIISAIASTEGVRYVETEIPNTDVIAAAVDPELNDHFYIVPGLGDAGDLLYGPKAEPNR